MTGRQLEDPEQILRMVRLLADVGYRDLARDSNGQRLAVARRLWAMGIDEHVLRLLRAYADTCGDRPVGLFCHWLGLPSRTEAKVAEMRAKNAWLKRAADNIAAESKAEEKAGTLLPFRKTK